MRILLLCIISFLITSISFAQSSKYDHITVDYSKSVPEFKDTIVFIYTNTPPKFPGGDQVLQEYIQNNLDYDLEAFWNGVEGKVQASFLIHPDGSISHIRIIKGLDPTLDKAVVYMIQNMPKWIPATVDHKPVTVNHFLPVKYKIGRPIKVKMSK